MIRCVAVLLALCWALAVALLADTASYAAECGTTAEPCAIGEPLPSSSPSSGEPAGSSSSTPAPTPAGESTTATAEPAPEPTAEPLATADGEPVQVTLPLEDRAMLLAALGLLVALSAASLVSDWGRE